MVTNRQVSQKTQKEWMHAGYVNLLKVNRESTEPAQARCKGSGGLSSQKLPRKKGPGMAGFRLTITKKIKTSFHLLQGIDGWKGFQALSTPAFPGYQDQARVYKINRKTEGGSEGGREEGREDGQEEGSGNHIQ